MFLENHGFNYILKAFFDKKISTQDVSEFHHTFELKHIAFLLKLLRIFIMAAFSMSKEAAQVYDGLSLARRSSSAVEDEDHPILEHQTSAHEGSRF